MEVLDNLWSFNFHKGKAFKTAIVRAKDERTAIQVAAEWCRQNGYRAPAGILPMVVADGMMNSRTAAINSLPMKAIWLARPRYTNR